MAADAAKLSADTASAPPAPADTPLKKTNGDGQSRTDVTSSGETRVIRRDAPRRLLAAMLTAYNGIAKAAVDSHPAIQKAREIIQAGIDEGAPFVEVSLPLAKDVAAASQKNVLTQQLAKDVVAERLPKEQSSHGAPKPTEAEATLRPKNVDKPDSAKDTHFPEAPAIALGDKSLQPQLACYKDTREKMYDQYLEVNNAARAIEDLNGLLRQVLRLDSSAVRYFARPVLAQRAGFQRELFLSMLMVRANPLAAIRLLNGLFGQSAEIMHLLRLAHGQGLISKETAENLKRLMEQPEIVPILNPALGFAKAEAKRKKSKKESEASSEQGEHGAPQHEQSEPEDAEEDELLVDAEESPPLSDRS